MYRGLLRTEACEQRRLRLRSAWHPALPWEDSSNLALPLESSSFTMDSDDST